jgi:16S rRNA (cytosine967-C5)-methyltransferase
MDIGAAGLAARRLAIYTVDRVVVLGRTLDESFNEGVAKLVLEQLPGRDRGFARLIATTTLRHLGSLDKLVSGFLDKPLPQDAGRTRFILATAAAQLVHLNTPPHAAISQAVDICRIDHTARRYDRLANAVLRRIAGEGKAIIAGLDTVPLDIPHWLFQRWVSAYGEVAARAIGAASLLEAPLDISVKDDATGWAEKLTGIVLPTGTVRVREAGRIEELPGFAEGAWWVQDAAAALPVRLLGDITGKRVADLCAAPGGKSAQLAARGATVVSVDASPKRNVRLKANMARLGIVSEIITADVAAFSTVLLDAPCSATGTIRRHPDLLHTKLETEIPRLAARQQEMLSAAIGLLKPGGRLVYVTCSLEPEEGEGVIDAVLATDATVRVLPITPELGIPDALLSRRRMLRTRPDLALGPEPAMVGMDGFFAAILERTS